MEKQQLKIPGHMAYVDELDITNIMLGLKIAKNDDFFGFGISDANKDF